VRRARLGKCVCEGRLEHFHTWKELAELSPHFAGEKISRWALRGWYDTCVEQNVNVPGLAVVRRKSVDRLVDRLAAKLLGEGRTQLVEEISDRVVDKLRAGPRRVA